MKFVPGDDSKESMSRRGLTFEDVTSAPVLDVIPNPNYPEQILLIVEIDDYAVVAPCERRGDAWRIITAFPSRKFTKSYLKP